jgi:hypothetical protein
VSLKISSGYGGSYPNVLVGFHDLLDAGEGKLMVFEKVDIFGHIGDLLLDFLELGL